MASLEQSRDSDCLFVITRLWSCLGKLIGKGIRIPPSRHRFRISGLRSFLITLLTIAALSKPIHPHLKLHGIHSRIRDCEPRIGNMFIEDASGKSAALVVEELEAQRRMRDKVYVRRIQRHHMAGKEHSAPQLQIRHNSL
jgi:hypothetical protein